MPDVAEHWTRADVLALPADGNRYELFDGRLLVSPSPRPVHQYAVWQLNRQVSAYVDTHGLGVTGMAPADLALGADQLAQPDLFVVPVDPQHLPRTWEEFPVPTLVAEVLSSSTARHDRFIKRSRYLASGVAVYWIIDLEARVFEEWRSGAAAPVVLTRCAEWRPDPAVAPLTIDLPTWFGRGLGS